MAFTKLFVALSNLDEDSKAPGRRPYWRPTMRIDGGGHGLLNEPLFATVAKESPSQMKICDGYSHSQVAQELMSYNHKKKSQKQAAGAPPSTGLEPWITHQLRDIRYLFGWCPGFEPRTPDDGTRRCTAGPMRLAAQPIVWVLTPANMKSAKN